MSRKSAVKELTCDGSETEARRRESSDSDYDEIEVHCLKGNKAQRRGMEQWKAEKPVFVEVVIEGQAVKMELDTRAAVSIFPLKVYKEKFSHVPLL